jgi:hypothetical protein
MGRYKLMMSSGLVGAAVGAFVGKVRFLNENCNNSRFSAISLVVSLHQQ